MPHYTPLIATIVVGLVLAFILGVIAHRLKISPLVGYLLAGVAGRAVDARLRRRPGAGRRAGRDRRDPADVRRGPAFLARRTCCRSGRIARAAARIVQIAVATAAGHGPRPGWSAGRWSAGLVFGLALSVASTRRACCARCRSGG